MNPPTPRTKERTECQHPDKKKKIKFKGLSNFTYTRIYVL